ncbi:glycoside hydrolase domain-containing protein [Allostreptomyces psammosilenae]|uniref:DUF1906 domain-containing protein n=1 Tax=Allostreptomyces psammosilenae TaxID=1892865 RepID=A0A852ZRU7_9ACTN|nr:glycoside hydrolase domain-containing protein [Allostreptomyces psammosilenae]NYI04525.1 hypothetical protein [Allostreptomyces psammosilenae]
MRLWRLTRGPVTALTATGSLLAPALLGTLVMSPSAAASPTVPEPAAASAVAPVSVGAPVDDGREVTFHGYRLTVPADWRVVDLTEDPTACVRFDVPTVYLGHPGADQNCPAGLRGRTDTVLVEPLDATSAPRVAAHAAVPRAGQGAPAVPPLSRGGELQVAVEDAGVLVTATHGDDRGAVLDVLDGARLVPGGRRVALDTLTEPSARTSAADGIGTMAVVPGTYVGQGFDACAAPSSSAMQAWLSSPYRAVGVYISGSVRACAQPNLTAGWVSEQTSEGWRLLPIHVGRQAPCNSYSSEVSTDPATARTQGRAAADESIAAAANLGIQAGSVLYNDMEAYDNTNTTCSRAVLSYLDGWTDRLHERGYRSGVYSSASSGIRDLSNNYNSTTYTRPDHIWFAWWNGVANTDAGSYVPDSQWANHQRVHQYRGDHNETHGGVTINIDSNYLDVSTSTGGGVNLDFPSYTTLSTGSTGAQVSAAQTLLNAQGFNAGTVDGVFGSATATAVRNFQSARGLSVDGVVGARTWTALLSAGSTPLLVSGSTGPDVERLQRALTAALGRTVTIDGVFGSGTQTAVRDYQSSRGLSVDGAVGAQTWGALQAGR